MRIVVPVSSKVYLWIHLSMDQVCRTVSMPSLSPAKVIGPLLMTTAGLRGALKELALCLHTQFNE